MTTTFENPEILMPKLSNCFLITLEPVILNRTQDYFYCKEITDKLPIFNQQALRVLPFVQASPGHVTVVFEDDVSNLLTNALSLLASRTNTMEKGVSINLKISVVNKSNLVIEYYLFSDTAVRTIETHGFDYASVPNTKLAEASSELQDLYTTLRNLTEQKCATIQKHVTFSYNVLKRHSI